MRLLYLTEEEISFSKPLVRGGAIHVRNVVTGLRERGHEVILIDWNQTPERVFQRSVAPQTRFVDGPIRTLIGGASLARSQNVDAIVSKTRKTYLPGLVAARLAGVPHLVHVGSSLNTPGSNVVDRMETASFVARLRAPHDGYLVVCEYIATQLAARGIDRSRIFNVKNAVDTEQFHPETVSVPLDQHYRRLIDDATSGALRLGYVGGLHSYKGLDDLTDALSLLDAECEVLIAGDGPERERLERAFGDRATFLGSVPYEQVPALYHEMDVFVLPSHTEGLPRVVLEAQATATPVVATRVGGVPEIIEEGETGLLCDSGRPTALAEKIECLATAPDLRTELGRCGRKSVAVRYSWDRMYDRYETYVGDVIDG